MLSIKEIVLVAPARAFVEIVLRGKEIGKVRLESIILFKNDFRINMGQKKKKRKEKEKKLLHTLFLFLYVKKKILLSIFISILSVSLKHTFFKEIIICSYPEDSSLAPSSLFFPTACPLFLL